MQKISVVIPTFNADQYIGAAIESVLAQDVEIHEICVVDDGSTDNTPSVLEKFRGRVRLFQQDNQGPSAARNRALDEATGDVMILLDADDTLEKNAASALTDAYELGIQKGKNIGVVYGDYWLVDSEQRYRRRVSVGAISRSQLVLGPCLIPSGMLVSRECVDTVGRFDSTTNVAEDWDYCLRIACAGFDFLKIPDVTCVHLEHGGSLSKNADKVIAGQLEVARRWSSDTRLLDTERARVRLEFARILLRRVRQEIYSGQRESAEASLVEALSEAPSLLGDPFLVSYCSIYIGPFFRETISLAHVERAITATASMVFAARQKLGLDGDDLSAGRRIALGAESFLRRDFVAAVRCALITGLLHPWISLKALQCIAYEWARTKAMRTT